MEKDQRSSQEGTKISIQASQESLNTVNPIRLCIERNFIEPIRQCQKEELFKVSVGDPSVFGNLDPHPAVKEAVKKALDTIHLAKMAHSAGIPEVRDVIAKHLCKYPTKYPLKDDDIFMTCGTHGALEISFRVLCEPGRSILISSPGYTIYSTLSSALGLVVKTYKLLPDRGWEVDLQDLERQVDENVAAIVLNNPSNPCGSVYSRQHLLDIIAVAEKHSLPIITDEIYADMVFKGKEFHPVGNLSENVPVLTCGGISKRYLVPGWRCGWLAVHDRNDIFKETVKQGISNLLTKLVAPASFIQAAIPDIFENTPESFLQGNMEFFEKNASLCYLKLKDVPGLRPVMPQGSLYMMVRIDMDSFVKFENDVEFMKQLIVEQGVVGLPGSIFRYPGSMRIVLIMPLDKLDIACDRIAEFCNAHYKQS